jgi:N-formylglutamate amidohydrolase
MADTDAIHERIAAHPWPRGGVEVIRANRGHTLYSRRTGGQVARLRLTGKGDDVQGPVVASRRPEAAQRLRTRWTRYHAAQ